MATAERQMSVLDVPPTTTALAAPAPEIVTRDPNDLRHMAMMLPVEQQDKMLAEYKERRNHFRDWLRAQLVEGLHFGYPPGCEPVLNADGWVGVRSQGSYKYYPPEQWMPKPSFYAAGADFVCDLLGIRPEYDADDAAWRQLGYAESEKKAFVFRCTLFSKATEQRLGEGRGVRVIGAKGGDENNAIKMAMKSAKVCAVLDTFGLRDLFSQDLEDRPLAPPQHDNPEGDADAPKAQPRGERVTLETVKALGERWTRIRQKRGEMVGKDEWLGWLRKLCGMADDYDFIKTANWTTAHVQRVNAELARLEATA